jgi:ribosome assembly protein 1
MRAWLPLSEAVLGMAVTHLPSPAASAPERMPKLLALRQGAQLAGELSTEAAAELARVESHLLASSSGADAPLVVFVSKMISGGRQRGGRGQEAPYPCAAAAPQQLPCSHPGVPPLCLRLGCRLRLTRPCRPRHLAVPASLLPRLPGDPLPASTTEEVFLAFGRVFSGVAREGQRVHVLSAAYDPSKPDEQRQSAVLSALYLMMGRGLERLQVRGGLRAAPRCPHAPRGSVAGAALHHACATPTAPPLPRPPPPRRPTARRRCRPATCWPSAAWRPQSSSPPRSALRPPAARWRP